jgi:hypothetical protein
MARQAIFFESKLSFSFSKSPKTQQLLPQQLASCLSPAAPEAKYSHILEHLRTAG